MQRLKILGAASVLALAGLAACANKPRPAPRPVARVVSPPSAPVCVDFSFPVYFDANSGRLTEAAEAVVQDAGARLKGCAVGRVEVLGLADAVGSQSANLAVSRRRANSVADALAGAGLPRPSFQLGAAGSSGALTPDGLPEPLRRRVEVVVRASPAGSAPSGPAPAAQPGAMTR